MRVLGISWIVVFLGVSAIFGQESLPPQKKSGTTKSNPAGSPATSKSGGTAKSGSATGGDKAGGDRAGEKTGTSKPSNGNTGSAKSAARPDTRNREDSEDRESLAAPEKPASARTEPNRTVPKPMTAAAKDQVSYAIGLDLATRFKAEGEDVNFELILKGLKDGYAGSKPAYTEEQMRSAMELFQQHMQVKAEQQLKNFAAENVAFLETNQKKPGIKVTKSGLQYQVLKSGKGKTPKSGDSIRANYHGTLIDGTVFETTSGEGGQPVEIPIEDTIPGWTEALFMMKVGDKWRLFIPAELAYGELGNGPVPPHATLIFELELLDVNPPLPPQKPEKKEQEAKSSKLLK